ncbi:MAG: response regulator [Bacteroidales bacterium]|nr:response regulator [Bacteroidales bacterium]
MDSEKTILYVDDEEINLILFEEIFNGRFTVFTANSGREGLEFLRTHRDVLFVISDFRMPGWNGIDFIKKAKDEFPDKNYYILSGNEMTPEISDALSKSVIKKFFRKPVMQNEIEKALA